MKAPSLDYNPLNISAGEIENRLTGLFDGSEWKSYHALFRKPVRDFNPFVTDNILIILNETSDISTALAKQVETARTAVKQYQREHLVYFWPLIEGKSIFKTRGFPEKFFSFSISPDADDSCLQQIVLKEADYLTAMIEELEFHRIGKRWPLCRSQKMLLSKTDGSYIAFFPGHYGFSLNSTEAVDLGSDMHILWYLKETGMESAAGYKETVEFVREAIETDIIVRDPFISSPYYANAALLHYIIARAVVWGKIEELYDLKPALLESAGKLEPGNISELVYLLSAALIWDDERLAGKFIFRRDSIPLEMAPVVTAPGLHTVPCLLPLARKRLFRIVFYSEAMLLAMALWIKRNR